MKGHISKSNLTNENWLRRMADLEDQHPSVSVGGMAYDLGMPQAGALPSSGVFGKFIELARRKQKLTAEGLAARAGVDLRELVAIEQNPNVQPRVMTVHQLAKFFELPPKPLMELAGLMKSKNTSIGTAAIRFAARSETIADLTPYETEAFDEFVKVIVEASDGY